MTRAREIIRELEAGAGSAAKAATTNSNIRQSRVK